MISGSRHTRYPFDFQDVSLQNDHTLSYEDPNPDSYYHSMNQPLHLFAPPDSTRASGGSEAPLANNSVIQLESVVKMNTIE